ncbi:MAG: hypothetical protein QM784_34585 [Polyangiaceae bacterium]
MGPSKPLDTDDHANDEHDSQHHRGDAASQRHCEEVALESLVRGAQDIDDTR